MYDRGHLQRLNAELAPLREEMAALAATTTAVNEQTFMAKIGVEYPYFADAGPDQAMTNILVEGVLLKQNQIGGPLRSGELTVNAVMEPPVGRISIQGPGHRRDVFYNAQEHRIDYGRQPLSAQEQVIARELDGILRENTLRQIAEIRECLEYGDRHPVQQARIGAMQMRGLPGNMGAFVQRAQIRPGMRALPPQRGALANQRRANLPAVDGPPAMRLARMLMNEYQHLRQNKVALEATPEARNVTRAPQKRLGGR